MSHGICHAACEIGRANELQLLVVERHAANAGAETRNRGATRGEESSNGVGRSGIGEQRADPRRGEGAQQSSGRRLERRQRSWVRSGRINRSTYRVCVCDADAQNSSCEAGGKGAGNRRKVHVGR